MSFFDNLQKQALLQLELAATVDWEEPFVKATYFLEGDGPLVIECYEAVQKVSEAARVGHTPNVLAVAQRLSVAPSTDQRCQTLVAYAKSCIAPGLEYYNKHLTNSLANSLAVLKGAQLFSPCKAHLLQPDAVMLEESHRSIPFFNSEVVN